MRGYIFDNWCFVFGTMKQPIYWKSASLRHGGFELVIGLFWLCVGAVKFSNYDTAADSWSAQRSRLLNSAAWNKGWPR